MLIKSIINCVVSCIADLMAKKKKGEKTHVESVLLYAGSTASTSYICTNSNKTRVRFNTIRQRMQSLRFPIRRFFFFCLATFIFSLVTCAIAFRYVIGLCDARNGHHVKCTPLFSFWICVTLQFFNGYSTIIWCDWMESDAITDWTYLPYHEQVCIGPDAIAHSPIEYPIQPEEIYSLFRAKHQFAQKLYRSLFVPCFSHIISTRASGLDAWRDQFISFTCLLMFVQWFSLQRYHR